MENFCNIPLPKTVCKPVTLEVFIFDSYYRGRNLTEATAASNDKFYGN